MSPPARSGSGSASADPHLTKEPLCLNRSSDVHARPTRHPHRRVGQPGRWQASRLDAIPPGAGRPAELGVTAPLPDPVLNRDNHHSPTRCLNYFATESGSLPHGDVTQVVLNGDGCLTGVLPTPEGTPGAPRSSRRPRPSSSTPSASAPR